MAQKSSTMGISTLRANLNTGGSDFQRSYLWEIRLPNIIGGTNVGDPSRVEKLAHKLQFGDYTFTPNTLKVGPLTGFFAGLLGINTFRIDFWIPSPNVLADYFISWKNLMVGSDGLFNVKSKYMANIYLRFLDVNGSVTGVYTMVSCFPIQFPFYAMDYSNNHIASTQITFSVDKIEYEDYPT